MTSAEHTPRIRALGPSTESSWARCGRSVPCDLRDATVSSAASLQAGVGTSASAATVLGYVRDGGRHADENVCE
jgi:hypothetical protein